MTDAEQDSTSAKPDTDLDLDDVAATSPKAKAELDQLRSRVALLEQELEAYQTDHLHQCIVCRHCYTPQQDESEDCPVCGCDGTLEIEHG